MIPSASNSEKENGFMTNNMRTRDIRRMILIGLIVALVSQLYWNIFINNFRISSSVIILPVLLMTLGKVFPHRSPALWPQSSCSSSACFRRSTAGPVSSSQRKVFFRMRSSISATALFSQPWSRENIPSPTAACFRPFFLLISVPTW